MGDEFTKYKQNKINALILEYNRNVTILTNTYNNNLRIIAVSKSSIKNKQNAITILKNNYTTNLNKLKIDFNTNVSIIQNTKLEPIVIINKPNSLLIGINYNGSQYQLNGCINDAESISSLLLQHNFKNTILLTDNSVIKPTKNNILVQLKNLLVGANPGDLIVFMYSGHGSYTRDTNGDEQDGRDEMILPLDFNIIKDDELKAIIDAQLKKDVTLFCLFDSCYSGTVMDLKYQYYDSLNGNKYSENTKTNETNGNVLMISGCSDNQTSADSFFNGRPQGAVTWSFLESLNQLQNPTWRELILKMRDLLKINKYSQIPQLSSGKFFDLDSNVFL